MVLYDILDEAKINTNKFLFIFCRSELCSSSRESSTIEVCGGYCHGYGVSFCVALYIMFMSEEDIAFGWEESSI